MKDGRSRRAYGGVNPQTVAPANLEMAGPLAAGAAHSDFAYNGGAVIRSPQVYTTFWGPPWSDAAHAARADRLNQFMRGLLNSDYMNVLSQYGVGAGAFVASAFVPDVPNQLNADGIASVIQARIDAGEIPEPPGAENNIVLVIFLDETIAVNEPGLQMCEPASDNAFGFHFDFVTSGGNEFYYTVIPALDDNCTRNTCPNGGCSLNLTQTQEARFTQATAMNSPKCAPSQNSGRAGSVRLPMRTATSATASQRRSVSAGTPGTSNANKAKRTMSRATARRSVSSARRAQCLAATTHPLSSNYRSGTGERDTDDETIQWTVRGLGLHDSGGELAPPGGARYGNACTAGICYTTTSFFFRSSEACTGGTMEYLEAG